MTLRYAYITTLLFVLALAFGTSRALAQERPPFTLDQIVRLIESGVFSDSRILKLTGESCLAFRFDDEAMRTLVRAGASQGLVAGLRRACVKLPQVITYVEVMPGEIEVPVGANRIVRARGLGPDSALISDADFEWSVEDTAVADVSAGGVVLGKSPGETRVVATARDGPAGSAAVRVTGPATAGAPGEGEAAAEAAGGKSPGAAVALGVIPGGGELYVGNTGKGIGILLGSAAAVAAGLLITQEDVLNVTLDPVTPQCDPATGICVYQNVPTTSQVKETNYLGVGLAVAGALALYGIIDAVRAAKKPSSMPQEAESGGLSIQLAPADGLRVSLNGYSEVTFIRIRS